MHQHRRRKKRPSYGVRTVEISRGKNGFGFTISGQAPCILSCIITGSPAEKAGLRPGDFLIAVNGQNVSKAPHDDVVRLIGNSNGVLKLQIAENYYSDSSEEEFISIVKLRPKYPNKVRNRQHQSSVSRAEKVVQDLQTGALFVDHIHGSSVVEISQKQRNSKGQSVGLAASSRSNKLLLDLILQQRIQDASNRHSLQNIPLQQTTCVPSVSSSEKIKQVCPKKKENKVIKSRSHPEHLNTSASADEVFHSIFTEQDLNNILYPALFSSQNNEEQKGNEEQAVLKAVVGYLGTIEMPKEPQLPNSRLQTIRNCIRRLRVEKKVHTLVLMSVFPESIILINPQGVTLAEFSADKITFSGVYSDDKKFFGLVTNHGISSDELSEGSQEDPGSVSSSCHVFMVDPKLTPHHQHMKRAKAFHITCTSDPVTNKCKEFPESADSILQAVVGLYRSKLGFNNEFVHGLEFHVNMSPQPSNTSSNSSNSDSGIGFRDE
ncbi:regulator of G-protein signaling 12-like, partial [Stegodyphus dumicola]|uniref:regulator of G-protein signaling 12-like n=1 Tax=Stegodyphus dumicola TaxID=202533 RepID=UPI0015B16AB3